MNHHPNAFGYIRVSTKAQAEDDHALESQTEEIRRFCNERGLNLIGVYEDVGSAAEPYNLDRRPSIQEITARAQREGACIVVPDPTRLFRREETARRWLQQLSVPVFSARTGEMLSSDSLLQAVRRGEVAAERTRRGTSEALAKKRMEGRKLGCPTDMSAATAASAKSRASRSDRIVNAIAYTLLEDPAYRDLSHEAFADLLNRRNVLTGWGRPWTPNGVKRQRSLAEERIREWEQLELGEDAELSDTEHLLRDASVSSAIQNDLENDEMEELRRVPGYGRF